MLIRSGEAPGVGWSRNMLYSGFNTLHRSVIRRQTGFAARITRTLCRRLFPMKNRKPIWTLNDQCPVCQQYECLVLLTCPGCRTVVAACDEDGTVFPNPTDLHQTHTTTCDLRVNTTTKCPNCNDVVEFQTSTSSELIDSGLTQQHYS